MGTFTAQVIVDDAEKTLLDDTNVRWGATELLNYLNDGQRAICIKKPDAYVKNTSAQLVAGTKQTIPTDGARLNRVVRNMGADGNTPGDAITEGDLDDMDSALPGWHTDSTSATVDQFFRVKNDPKTYYVYPPQPASGMGYVEQSYCAVPADVAAIGNTITIDDIYRTALYYYILSRALAKQSPVASEQKAAGYYDLFIKELTDQQTGEAMTEAKR